MRPTPAAPDLSTSLCSEELQARWRHLNQRYFEGSNPDRSRFSGVSA